LKQFRVFLVPFKTRIYGIARKLSEPSKPAPVIVIVLVLVVIINVRSFALNIQDFCAPLN